MQPAVGAKPHAVRAYSQNFLRASGGRARTVLDVQPAVGAKPHARWLCANGEDGARCATGPGRKTARGRCERILRIFCPGWRAGMQRPPAGATRTTGALRWACENGARCATGPGRKTAAGMQRPRAQRAQPRAARRALAVRLCASGGRARTVLAVREQQQCGARTRGRWVKKSVLSEFSAFSVPCTGRSRSALCENGGCEKRILRNFCVFGAVRGPLSLFSPD